MSWDHARRTAWGSLNGVEDHCAPANIPANEATTTDPETLIPAKSHSLFFGLLPTAHEFAFPDLFRTVAFGGSVGGLTGLMFGFMDAMKTVQESKSLITLSNAAKGRYIFKTCTHSSLIFGGFFAAFHTTKYATRLVFDSSDEFQIATGTLASMGGLMYQQSNRRLAPYAVMLIGFDTFNLLWREGSDTKGLRPDGSRVGEVQLSGGDEPHNRQP